MYHSHLRPILLAGIIKFREEMQRLYDEDHPFAGVPGGIRDNEDGDWEVSQQKWLDILDKMIYAFEDDEDQFSYDAGWSMGEGHGEKCDETGYTRWDMIANDQDAWDKYLKDMIEHQEKVQEGLDLFAKYARNLWW